MRTTSCRRVCTLWAMACGVLVGGVLPIGGCSRPPSQSQSGASDAGAAATEAAGQATGGAAPNAAESGTGTSGATQIDEIRQGGENAVERAAGETPAAGAAVPPVASGGSAAAGRSEPVPSDPGVADEEVRDPGEPEDPARVNPLADLPGFSPSQVASAAETSAPPAAAAPTPGDNVLVNVTVVRLTPAAAGEIEPLREFLRADEASALNADEATALADLVTALEAGSVVRVLTRPRVLCQDGQAAAVTVGVVDETPGAPEQPLDLTIEVRPFVGAPGADARGLVKVDYDVRAARAGADAGVSVEGLTLAIGPRSRVAGTAVVAPGDTFYFVRRVGGAPGAAGSMELLVLVRPQPVAGELNK